MLLGTRGRLFDDLHFDELFALSLIFIVLIEMTEIVSVMAVHGNVLCGGGTLDSAQIIVAIDLILDIHVADGRGGGQEQSEQVVH